MSDGELKLSNRGGAPVCMIRYFLSCLCMPGMTHSKKGEQESEENVYLELPWFWSARLTFYRDQSRQV